MDLDKLTVDVKAVEEGSWVDQIPELGDISFKVRGFGNALYRKMQTDLMRATPIAKRMDQAEQERINTKLLIETVLLDWKNLTRDGAVVPYSKDTAAEILNDPAYQRFKDGVTWAAHVVAEMRADDLETDGKN